MKRIFLAIFSVILGFSVLGSPVFAQENLEDLQNEDIAFDDLIPAEPYVVTNEYYKGKVVEIIEDGEDVIGTFRQKYQKIKVRIISGPDELESFEFDYQLAGATADQQKLEVDDKVVVVKVVRPDDSFEYYVTEPYRFPIVIWFLILFLVAAIVLARGKGVRSLLGLGFSLATIIWFILPQIVAGKSPLLISLTGAVLIMIFSLYLAHGINKRTHVALAGTTISLFLSAGLAVFVASFANLFGLGSEEALSLLQGQLKDINLQGLFLGGVIIGTLGVLDDITTAQSATVEELHRANPALSAKELYKRGESVGREHIIALVNTLALAYVGASLPLMLIFTQVDFPLWVTLNSEFIVEEIMRTLVGSLALIAAVPITTFIASRVFENAPVDEKNPPKFHGHHH